MLRGKAASLQLSEISLLILLIQARRLSYTQSCYSVPETKKGRESEQVFLALFEFEMTLWSHYRKSSRSILPYTHTHHDLYGAGSVSNLPFATSPASVSSLLDSVIPPFSI